MRAMESLMTRYAVLVLLTGLAFVPVVAAPPGAPAEPPEGVLPKGPDGRPLNFDFETGTLKDWVADGDAFKGQPVKGDTVSPRRSDMKSQHQGEYWVGTYERHGDRAQGTLSSVPFKVTHPWASFLVGGGAYDTTGVELALRGSGEVIFRASGVEEENLRRVAVDLRPYAGQEIFIRVVDRHTGPWGHINFDDFRFHSAKPDVPPRPTPPAAPDVYRFAGLPPERAPAAMTVPEGFTVKLFAGEPDVKQPIAMCLDDRGRLWVAEAYSYPVRRPEGQGKDRIVIFEDTDGDGHFDKRTVFMEGLNLVSGLEVGFGGVWIGAAPYFLFVPVNEGEDRPAGPPKVLLDGWGYEDTHETLNTFTWGPDGWLYGCHGVFTHSRVGKPGTPDARRVPLNAAVWRYHPTRHVFEVFAHGTSNPWGLDFDDHGQAFCEACVIPHLFHVIQGARYYRQAGEHFNPYTYADIPTIADHLHWAGRDQWVSANRSGSYGGGHAHCGLMAYLGGAWPAEYHGKLFMGNIHGHRLNLDVPRPRGSGFVASHGPDFLLANDAWARFINMHYGPDGNVYLIDWFDKQACHTGNPDAWDRSNGRIYKVCYRGTKPALPDLRKLSEKELVEHQLNPNDWYVRHARRILQERAAAGRLSAGTHDALAKIAFEHADETRRLRGLWALHVTGGLNEERLERAWADKGPYARAWTIQLALEAKECPESLRLLLVERALRDASPVVRLYLASALQRLQLDDRWSLAQALVRHAEDADDHNLPLMVWYGVEPLADRDAGRALSLAVQAKLPMILPFMVRRIASSPTPETVTLLVDALRREEIPARRKAFLLAMNEAWKGRRHVDMPDSWALAFEKLARSSDAEVKAQAFALAVTFGDSNAFVSLRHTLRSAQKDIAERKNALAALLGARDRELAPVLQQLVADAALRGAALRGLAAYDDPRTPGVLLAAYPSLSSEEKRDALNTLASRAAYGKALLEAVADGRVPAKEVSAELVRQLRNLHDKDLDRRLGEVWGVVRATPADRVRMMEHYRRMLTAPGRLPPDRCLGRAVFVKVCAQCHTLFGSGGQVGPDITGSNRASLDYLLENILDPSAVIPKEYAATVLDLKSGRTVTGIVRGETPAALTVVTANETLTVPRDEIETRTPSNTSMMPDDLLKPLGDDEVRGLIAYLQGPSQVPVLATAENAKDFFNGKDLAGWDGDPGLWKVEGGDIVGRSPGLKRNEFLRSQMAAGDFRLTVKVKLVPDAGNSGIQLRSEALPDGEMRGPQADIGAGWWGKLYDENGRGVLWDKPGDPFVKRDGWNDYEVVATGTRIRTWLNGKLCVDLDDPSGPRRGIFALQLHSGDPMEVRFKDLRLEVPPPGGKK
jgi:putative membrane-bound dehydrogenase-like protein